MSQTNEQIAQNLQQLQEVVQLQVDSELIQVTFHMDETISPISSVQCSLHRDETTTVFTAATPPPEISFNDLHYPRASLQILSAMLGDKQEELNRKREFEVSKRILAKKDSQEQNNTETKNRAELVLMHDEYFGDQKEYYDFNEYDDIFENVETDIKKLKELPYYRHHLERGKAHKKYHPGNLPAQMAERLSWTLARFPYYETQKQKEIFALILYDFKTKYHDSTLFLDFSDFGTERNLKLNDADEGPTRLILEIISIRFLEKILLHTPSIKNIRILQAWYGTAWDEDRTHARTIESMKAFFNIFNNLKRDSLTLDLSNEWVFEFEDCYKLLCDFILENRTITTLNMSNTEVPKHYVPIYKNPNCNDWHRDYHALFTSIQNNNILEALYLGENLGEKVIRDLGELIKKNKTLKRLKIDKLLPFKFNILLKALAWNRSIEQFDVTTYFSSPDLSGDGIDKKFLLECLNTRFPGEPSNLCSLKDVVGFWQSVWPSKFHIQEAINILIKRNQLLASKSKYFARAAFVIGLYEHELKSNKKKWKGERQLKDKPLQVCSAEATFSKNAINLIFQFAELQDAPIKEQDAPKKEQAPFKEKNQKKSGKAIKI